MERHGSLCLVFHSISNNAQSLSQFWPLLHTGLVYLERIFWPGWPLDLPPDLWLPFLIFSNILLCLKAFYQALLQISLVLLISILDWSSHLVQAFMFTLIQKAFNSLNANIFCKMAPVTFFPIEACLGFIFICRIYLFFIYSNCKNLLKHALQLCNRDWFFMLHWYFYLICILLGQLFFKSSTD